MTESSGQPGRLQRLRDRYPWFDHLVRAAQAYTTHHGDYYAAAITYFSVLALVPLLMIVFAVTAFVLAADPALLAELQNQIAASAPEGLGTTINSVIDEAIASRGTVGVIGLLGALYSGIGWMSNLRNALSAQWEQPPEESNFLASKLYDLVALVGLGLALIISFGLTGVGTAFSRQLLDLVGLGDVPGIRFVMIVISIVVAIGANWLVFLWVIARLPRQPVALRSAVKAALFAAVGFEVLKQAFTLYLGRVLESPAGQAFGPLLGLLVFAFFVSRFLLFVTAWAATARENQPSEPPPPPPPAVISPAVQVRSGPDGRTTAGLVGVGAILGLVGSRFVRRR